MKLDKYVEIFKKEYDAKIINFQTQIKDYFSRSDMYGEELSIERLSEGIITTDRFITLIVEGKEVDPQGEFLWGTKAHIIFVEYTPDGEVNKYCLLSSFCFISPKAKASFYNLLEGYEKKV